MAQRKKRQFMGRVILCLGIILKIIQIIGAAFSVNALSGSNLTLITTCLLVGGLAVFAVEKLNVTSIFASVAAVSILVGILPITDPNYAFTFMAICFICFGSMLISMKRSQRIFCGVAVFALTVLLALHIWLKVLTLPYPVLTIVLVAIYALTGIGVFL